MNNTRRTLAISAVLAVTLVVRGMLEATSSSITQSAFAYKKKDRNSCFLRTFSS